MFDLQLTAGKPVNIRVEWEPDGGYIALEHNGPQPEADRHSISFASEAARAIDYYYIGGDNLDQVIAGFRHLTGKAALAPKWAYGFWQSRQRYETQDQLLGVLGEYRKRGLPLDNIVQDWLYWPQDAWGCQCFDPKRFPDPKGMVDAVHAANAHIMISVWAKYYKGLPTFNELDSVHGIYRRMTDPRPDEPKDPAYIKNDVPGLGRARLLERLLRRLQPSGEEHLLAAGAGRRDVEGLRRALARFRRARFPFQPLGRRDCSPDESDGRRPGPRAIQQLSAGARRRRLSGADRLPARRPAVHPHAIRRSPAFSATALRSGPATSRRAGTTSASRSRPA